jgi:hypothetical protein
MTSPTDKVRYGNTVYGSACYVDRRTAAHLDRTKLALPHGCTLRLLQGCFNTTVSASAGTHDRTSVVDAEILGMSWAQAQRFMREQGWAAWWRTPAQGFSAQHLHCVSLGYGTAPVGVYVPGQVDDYLQHKTGLVSHAHDPSWFPPNIAATVFDYAAWQKEQDMPSPKDWDAEDWAAIKANIPAAVWSFKWKALPGMTAGVLLKNIARKEGVDK